MLLFYLFVFVLLPSYIDCGVYCTRNRVPRLWTKAQLADDHDQLEFYILCKQEPNSIKQLKALFWNRTDPTHPDYQQWFSKRELQKLVQSTSQCYQQILQWLLKSVPSEHITKYPDCFKIKTSLNNTRALFQQNTEFYTYTHTTNKNVSLIRLYGDCHIPDDTIDSIDLILGIYEFPLDTKRKSRINGIFNLNGTVPLLVNNTLIKNSVPFPALPTPFDLFTTQFILDYYQIPNVTCQGLPRNVSQGAIEFAGEYYTEEDLQIYCALAGIPYKPLEKKHIIGTNDPNDPVVTDITEAALDIQILASINPKADNWYFDTDPNDNTWLYIFTMIANHLDQLPQVMSISWGSDEGFDCVGDEDCDTFDTSPNRETIFIERVNIEFMKLGLRGISIIVSSGDDGANGDILGNTCAAAKFYADYPASSPYVTAVGATALKDQKYDQLKNTPPICSLNTAFFHCVSDGKEVAVSISHDGFTSGGGFSDYQQRPKYQEKVVQEYLKEQKCQLPPSTMFNQHGRAYPDLSALGDYTFTVAGNLIFSVGGTSMSAPLFGAIVSILNSYSLECTGKTLGFLNPLLYFMYEQESTKIFKDITEGDNRCTETTCTEQCKGFFAAKGYDPVTGLGTPKVEEMIKFIQNLHKEKGKLEKEKLEQEKYLTELINKVIDRQSNKRRKVPKSETFFKKVKFS
ncbi:unnamed protein product [Didymodactylos carnosus]|uniref:Tripeptidyl-peptidase 1 n=1 Tax=Didymodactylos carnosus TaxID=1234261 RepID=A0A815E8G2_9BILA|nr:unnamed protein product [Didymodactylos carnosus]CAF1308059.1 unnamed protein product [Didymodactylos carnosus]CAF3836904.1 unnamed protein product [Didymodactylos carnosus]CAF4142974.1 unnamed protein product [Didymodactylos carnosus]